MQWIACLAFVNSVIEELEFVYVHKECYLFAVIAVWPKPKLACKFRSCTHV